MVEKIKENGIYNTKIDQFVIDTAAEVANLPTNVNMGSIAFCIATKTFYMINSNKVWTAI